jgi:hypothetical protein
VLIMLAPMIRLIPVAIAKNEAIAEKSRMRGRGLEAHYSISRTSQGERNSPLQSQLDLKHKCFQLVEELVAPFLAHFG